MKIGTVFILVGILVFLAGSYLTYAQQGLPGGRLAPAPWGQRSSQPSKLHSSPPAYRQAREAPRGMPSLAESKRRRCELAASVARPSAPPVVIPRPEGFGTIPIQGFSPSSPDGDITRQGAIPYPAGIGIIGFEEERLQGVIAKPQGRSTGSSRSASKVGGASRQYPVAPIGDPFFYEPISSVEAAFYEVSVFTGSGSRQLRQFGYSLFESPTSTFSAVENVPVGPDYILGPGDDLLLKIWGSMEGQVVLTVDRNGEIKLPSAGPVRVWGLGFSQVDQLIRDELSRYYRGFKASVTMGRLRAITVYVVGEVCQPGAFTLSSLSSVTNALFAAGGPLKLGSLRNIELKRKRNTVGKLDLYDLLLRGDKHNDFRLRSGDTIFVPSIGAAVGITGEVRRPAIYEVKEGTDIRKLIEMAGGVTPRSNLKRVQVIRAKHNAEREIIDLDLTGVQGNGNSSDDLLLRGGDFVKIYPTDPRIYNTIRLEGAVKYPGEYELKQGMRLSNLLTKGSLLPEAYADSVEISRLNDDLTTEIISANLKKAWEGDGTQNIVLNRMDLVSVKSNFKIPAIVKLVGEIVRPGVYRIKPGERLSSVLIRAGGFTDKAFLRGAVFTRTSVEIAEKRRLVEFVTFQEQLLLADTTQKNDLTLRREQLKLLASKIKLGRIVVHLDQPEHLAGSPNDVILMDGDRLEVSQKPATVLVMGSVRTPTAVLHWEDGDVQYYLNRAGGLTPDADENQIYVIRADGSAVAGFMKLRDIEAGDGIIVPPSTKKHVDKLPLIRAVATITGQLVLGLAGLLAIF